MWCNVSLSTSHSNIVHYYTCYDSDCSQPDIAYLITTAPQGALNGAPHDALSVEQHQLFSTMRSCP